MIYDADHYGGGWSVDINLNVVGPRLEVPLSGGFSLKASIHFFEPRQPYRFVLIGEKNSLADVLEPIARRYEATLALPAGEISDTMLHEIVRRSAADGRPTVIFYFSDCDPSGFQMPITVSRKVQAFRDLKFPDLDVQVQSVALTVEQVRHYGLPSTPLKASERRADRWKEALASSRPRSTPWRRCGRTCCGNSLKRRSRPTTTRHYKGGPGT